MKLFNRKKEKKVDPAIRIRVKMAENNIKNVQELAKSLNWNYYTLWNKLSGRRPWSLEEARELSLLFDISIENLFYGESK